MTDVNEERLAALRRMARESYLALPPDEVEELARQVAGLLDNVDVLAALPDAEGPTAEAVAPETLRRDEATPSLTMEEATANVPDAHDGFVAVPKIIGGAEGDDAA